MPSSSLSNYLTHLRGILARQENAESTDGQLLECYLLQRDERAFEMLVRRHGPMTAGVAPDTVLAGVEPAAEKVAADEEKKVVSVKQMPPVVVKTMPQSGDTKVDADKVKEIRVTFSKDMMDKSWSWTQISEETFPKGDGEVHYDKDRRTCVLPVKLEPGKTYVIWLNSAQFGNFKDTERHSAVPYLLVFETKPKE